MKLTSAIAARTCSLTFEHLSPQAVWNAKLAILDTVGCALAGAHEPVVHTLLRTWGLNTLGAVPVLGRHERLDPLCAALVNGAAAHALDFDDVNIAMGGHPTAPMLPALLALAAEGGYTGRQLLLAYVAGFETQARLAQSHNFHHYDKGWHPTATLGVFGAAAASARLLGLDEQQTSMALALCVSLASGVKANCGTMAKPYHVGHAARNGLMAALLTRNGFTASLDAFEHRQGFFEVFNGPGNYTPALALQNWAAPLDIVEPGIGIKLCPCCDSTHSSLDALFTMRRDHPFEARDVAAIEVYLHPLRLTHVDRPLLRTSLDAKFSVQYCLARALIDGRIVLDSSSEHAFKGAEALALMQRIHALPHPTPSLARPGNYLNKLHIRLHDGMRLTVRSHSPAGRTADQPAPLESIMNKFNHNAAKALDAQAVATLSDTLMRMEQLQRAEVIGDLCVAR